MSDTYTYDQDQIQEASKVLSVTVNDLQSILTKSKSLKQKVESYGGWQGKQKKELVSFLDLLIRYHSDLVKDNDSPFVQYKQALEQLCKDIEGYTGYAKSYKELSRK